jgi:hypothetical protein
MTKITNTNEVPEYINEQLNETLGIDEQNGENYEPIYRMYGENRIPVSKVEGKLWSNRKNQAVNVMKDVSDAWDMAYRYFNADQIGLRDDGSYEFSKDKLRNNKENTENLIWANNTGILPALYSQDPRIEITNNKDKNEVNNKMCTMLERIVNVLFTKRVAPGLNLKSKIRKAIMNCALTNRGIIKVGYNFKDELSEDALQQINLISGQLQEAKTIKEIKELEGKLQALEEVIDYTNPSGPFVKHVRPYDLFIDPNAEDQDGTDARWIMEREWLPTEYLKAKFGKQNDDSDEVESIYKPGKVLPVGSKSIDEVNDEEVLTLDGIDDINYKDYGYDNVEQYKRSCLTECFWVWDKTKRRVYLYSNNDWSFPLWVWNDPYELEEFYPYHILNFHESPNGTLCKGEVSYYLDQQNTINMINAQLQKMRKFGFNHYLFDSASGVDVKDIMNWANGNKSIASIKLPPNKKFEDILFAGSVPYDKNQMLYDKQELLRVVDMISGTDAATRSGEYKTNTTNLAIQQYAAGKQSRIDDKRDLIENFVGRIGWSVAQLCLMNMTIEQVSQLIGEENTQGWMNYQSFEITNQFSLRCVGGSTVKPTSEVKKQQALQLSQILGQFAGASPIVTIIMLQIMERAFDEVVIKEEDFTMIKNSILQQMQAQQMQAQQQAQLANAQAEEAISQSNLNDANSAATLANAGTQQTQPNIME